MSKYRWEKNFFVGTFLSKERGFTFVEVLVTVIVLSVGITMIFKAFFVSLDYINHLTRRLYANVVIDNKMTYVQRQFAETGSVPPETQQGIEQAVFNNKIVTYSYFMSFQPINNVPGIVQVKLNLSWPERNRNIRMARTGYILLE